MNPPRVLLAAVAAALLAGCAAQIAHYQSPTGELAQCSQEPEWPHWALFAVAAPLGVGGTDLNTDRGGAYLQCQREYEARGFVRKD
jgi:hypothetical protein